MLHGIVGFEIAVERLDAKFKLSQNRNETDRANVAAALERSADRPPAASPRGCGRTRNGRRRLG